MIRLKSGGAVRGQVVTSASPGDVTVRTSTGGPIVLERRAIRQSGAAVALAKSSSSRKSPSAAGRGKSPLTAEQRAWLPRVRSRVEAAC